MVATRKKFGFRIVNWTNNQIVKEDEKTLSDKEFEKEDKKWEKEANEMGWQFFYISTLK